MGRRKKYYEVMDDKLHAACSSYLYNRFFQLCDREKTKLSLDIIKKFGVTKIENTTKIMTPDEQKTISEIFQSSVSKGLITPRLPIESSSN